MRARRAIPGFGLSVGVAVLWVSLVVAVPLAALVLRPIAGPGGITAAGASLADPRVLAALRLSFGAATLAALIATALGLLLAWSIERARVPGHRVLDAAIDLPFALPTAVAGITLAALLAPNGLVGGLLAPLGIRPAFHAGGIVVALVFVGLPFAVRAAGPVLRGLDAGIEEAAATLGASGGQIARRIVLPTVAPALVTGFGLALARAIGEYGSVIFIAGNRPGQTEIAPLLIVIRLQEFDYRGAAAIGLAMLLAAAGCLLAVSLARRFLFGWAEAGAR